MTKEKLMELKNSPEHLACVERRKRAERMNSFRDAMIQVIQEHGFTAEEIALFMKMPVSRVKARLDYFETCSKLGIDE